MARGTPHCLPAVKIISQEAIILSSDLIHGPWTVFKFQKKYKQVKYCSDLSGEDSNDTNVGRLIEHDRNETISLGVPVGGGSALNGGTIVLLDDASHNVFKVFTEL